MTHLTVWEIAANLNAIARSFHEFGGPLHIVWDDYNEEDGFIRYCLDSMDEWYAEWHSNCDAPTVKVCRVVMEELAEALLLIPEDQRYDYLRTLANTGSRS